ncbi:IS66 family transposase, partial [Thiolapillus sp.]
MCPTFCKAHKLLLFSVSSDKDKRYRWLQRDLLTGYCQDGKLHISNVLAENAIRPFAVGRKNWLFADTPR